jgi:hypothetical protein
MNLPTDPSACPVCEDALREAMDLYLVRGNSFEAVAKKFGRPAAFAEALKAHAWCKHVRGPTRENYLVLIVDYMQDSRKMLERELLKQPKNQRTAIITLAHRAQQWAFSEVARIEGLTTAGNKKLSGDVISALNQLAEGNPEAVKRIAAARQKETPILITATPVEGKEATDVDKENHRPIID